MSSWMARLLHLAAVLSLTFTVCPLLLLRMCRWRSRGCESGGTADRGRRKEKITSDTVQSSANACTMYIYTCTYMYLHVHVYSTHIPRESVGGDGVLVDVTISDVEAEV